MQELREHHRMSLDSGMVVVIIICMMYMVLVFGLLFYVKNDWCDLLFKNFTVRKGIKNLKSVWWEGEGMHKSLTLTKFAEQGILGNFNVT